MRPLEFALAALVTVASPGPFLAAPVGVAIPVRLTERLSSQDAAAGQTFGFETTAAVQIGPLLVPAGTKGRGHVVVAESGRGAHVGRLSIAADELDLPNGARIRVGIEIGGAPPRERPAVRAFPIPVPVDGGIVFVGTNSGGDNNVVFARGTPLTLETVPLATPLPLPSVSP